MLVLSTSKTDSPESRLSAANSKIMVPAHAVQVSVSVPVRDRGLRTPYRKFTYMDENTLQLRKYIFIAVIGSR